MRRMREIKRMMIMRRRRRKRRRRRMLRRKADPKISQDREAHLVRVCAVEMNMDMSQEAFCTLPIQPRLNTGP